ncbi:uncharacterized protein LOC119386310 [Rhipicephalus sanguineus]|uniref:uncharacterized protein LOC119386310 n=1 Tax=Rhipicephalus sanguineus TaxID=34632 RepID=UPI001893CF6F|nr:uncharacterized protein LOC119386310 [Rhipicephalus sanguineus]
MANPFVFYAPQVCNCFSIFARKSDNRYLVMLPCPRVLCETLCNFFDSSLLLLCCGDIESNPGPPRTRSTQTEVRLTSQQASIQNRLDDLEDRSRRDNLIIHGIPDARETWQQTEQKALDVLSTALGRKVSESEIERAHRLGRFTPSKCRPVIIKFSCYKTRGIVLAARSNFKEKKMSVVEDFSVATRLARRKLAEFAKSLPGSPNFQLRYNKLIVNNMRYKYDGNSVIELNSSTSSEPFESTLLPAAPHSSDETLT